MSTMMDKTPGEPRDGAAQLTLPFPHFSLFPDVPESHTGIDVASTVEGRPISALDGLKRFLIHTEQLIKEDSQHFLEEAASDVFAFEAAFPALFESMHQWSSDPAEEEIKNIISAIAAFYLMYSIHKQRKSKQKEFDKALRLFVDYEADLENPEYGSDRERRRLRAEANLEEKMRHAGLQYTALPDSISEHDFRESHFRKLASRRGILPTSKNFAERLKNVGHTLRRPEESILQALKNRPLETMDASHAFMQNVVGRFITVVISNYLDRNIYINTVKGYGATKKSIGIKLRRLWHRAQRPHISKIPKHELTIADLRRVTPKSFEQIGHDFTEDEKQQVRDILQSLSEIETDISRSRLSLIIQSIFTVMQLANFVEGAFFEKNIEKSWKSAYSFSASLGPLSGFGKELFLKLANRYSETSKEARKLAEIMGVDGIEIPPNSNPAPATDLA